MMDSRTQLNVSPHLFIVSCLVMSACGGQSEPEGSAPVGCMDPPSGQCFTADWRVSGTAMSAQLVSSDPMEPIKGRNSWTVELKTLSGEPLEGCALHIAPYMPDHGHGSNEVDSVEPSPGSYELSGFELTMPGYWELRIDATCPDIEPDAFSFDLWLES